MTGAACVLDAHNISNLDYTANADGFVWRDQDGEHGGHFSRGWLRRLAPESWLGGLVVESREWAEKAAWLALLGFVVRSTVAEWLTPVDAVNAAENKLTTAVLARRLKIAHPETIVTNSARTLTSRLNGEAVFKPLGPGWYVEGGRAKALFASALRTDSVSSSELGWAPFVAQEKLLADEHIRVVTVRNRAWCASLDAEGLPLDWRADLRAHTSFVPRPDLDVIAAHALNLAGEMGLGYSSQDWIVSRGNPYVLEVNPSGQWLFLPEPIATEVASAIASWLDGSGGPER